MYTPSSPTQPTAQGLPLADRETVVGYAQQAERLERRLGLILWLALAAVVVLISI